MKKHITSTIVLIPLLSVFDSCLYAGTYSGGTGEPGDSYRIATAEDMNDIANHPLDFDKHFILVNDIDLGIYDNNEYNVIGSPYTGGFEGVFDGNNHTISNLELTVNESCTGLFGYIESNGVVRNVRLENIGIKAYSEVGGIAGGDEGLIQDCNVSGIIAGEQACGGITGYCSALFPLSSSQIRNCSFRGKVSGTWATGGIVGRNGALRLSIVMPLWKLQARYNAAESLDRTWGGNFSLCFSKGTVGMLTR